jgi:hypothetical protein
VDEFDLEPEGKKDEPPPKGVAECREAMGAGDAHYITG